MFSISYQKIFVNFSFTKSNIDFYVNFEKQSKQSKSIDRSLLHGYILA